MSSRHYIDDFMRGRIIGKIEEGRKITDVAREFDIFHSVVSRLWKSFKTTGMCSRRHGGGRVRNLNLIENVWDALGRQVAGRNYPPTNKNTLIRALTEEWDKLPQQLLDNVVESMVRRVECCIILHGGHIPQADKKERLNRRSFLGICPQSHIVRVYDAWHGESGVFHSAEWHEGDWLNDGIRETWPWCFIWVEKFLGLAESLEAAL
ncbi:hypothetical protein TNCV_3916951 [Trichonephila clavipes]|nr:hypothetical protein TNCV_3916951 [Trichonephila clavipes]